VVSDRFARSTDCTTNPRTLRFSAGVQRTDVHAQRTRPVNPACGMFACVSGPKKAAVPFDRRRDALEFG